MKSLYADQIRIIIYIVGIPSKRFVFSLKRKENFRRIMSEEHEE